MTSPPAEGGARRDGRRTRCRLRPEALDVPPAVRRQRARRHGASRRAGRALRVAPVRRREARVPERDASAGRARLDRIRHVLRRAPRNARVDRTGAVRRPLGTRRPWPATSPGCRTSGTQRLFSGGLGWIDRDGISRVSDRDPTGSGLSVADRAYFKNVASTGKPFISEGLVTRSDAKPGRDHGCPDTRHASGRVSGVLAGRWSCAGPARASARSISASEGSWSSTERASRSRSRASRAPRTGLFSRASGRATACLPTPRASQTTRAAWSHTRTRLRPPGRSHSIALGRQSSRPPAGASRSRWLDPRRGRHRARHRRVGHRAVASRNRSRTGTGAPLGRAGTVARRGVRRRRGVGRPGRSLATAFPGAHVIVALQDDETGGFAVWTYGGGDTARSPAPAGARDMARLGCLSPPLRITLRAAVGTVVSPLGGTVAGPGVGLRPADALRSRPHDRLGDAAPP